MIEHCFSSVFQADYGRVSYRIVGEGRASNMFEVNPSTCEVTLRNALTSDNAQAYTVRTYNEWR